MTPDALGELQRLDPQIYAYLQPEWGWGMNNAGVILDGERCLVIDTCLTAARTRAVAAAVAKLSRTPPRLLVNTHHHGDHTFGNYQFGAATIVAHRACRDQALAAGLSLMPFFPGVQWGDIRVRAPNVTFDDRLELHVDGLRVELLGVGPAHTQGDVVVWVPDRRLLFAGDVVFNHCTPLLTDGSLSGSFAALDRLRALRPEIVVAGHGPVCGPEVFDKMAAYLRFVQRAAQAGFEEGLSPLDAARRADLGSYAEWGDAERLVANIARAYSELRGEPAATALDRAELAPMMIEYAGHPLMCAA